jgi:hypothetical protein
MMMHVVGLSCMAWDSSSMHHALTACVHVHGHGHIDIALPQPQAFIM